VERTVDFVDIAYDEVSSKHYKEEEVNTLPLIIITYYYGACAVLYTRSVSYRLS